MSRINSLGPVLTIIALVATACVADQNRDGDNHGTGSGSGSGSGSSSGGDAAPRAGVWHYTGVTLVSNTCDQSINRGEAGNFGIDQVVATSFRVIPDDGTAPFTCMRLNSAFTCPDRASFVDDYRPGLDAVIAVHVTADGTFSSTTRATGSQDGTIDCAGTQCAVLGTLPCTFTQDFVIQAL